MQNWQQFVIPSTSTILEAIALLELNQCVVVVDELGRLVGTVTDRDVRKALLQQYRISDPISEIINTTIAHHFVRCGAPSSLVLST